MKLKFSIIIPIYNGEKYIEKCLESIFAQTYTNYEILIINDGSTDNTLSKLKKIINNKLIVINIENNGLSIARNIGIEKALGEYIIFIDVDDTINKDLLFKIYDTLEEKCYDMVRFQASEIHQNKNTNKKTFVTRKFREKSGREAMIHFVRKNEIFSPVWLYAYKVSFLKNSNLYFEPNILQEDFRFLPFALINARSLKSIEYIGYNYNLTENSIMRNHDYDKAVLKAFNMIDNYEFLLHNVVYKYHNIYEQNKLQIYLYKAVFRKIKYLKQIDKNKFIKKLKRTGEISMLETEYFFKNMFNKAVKLKEKFKVAEKNEWNAMTVLLELSVQIGHLEFIVAEGDAYEEIGRIINNKGDEIADILLQLSALSNKLAINPEDLNVNYKFISYERETKYLESIYILFGQLTEAIMEDEGYRFDKSRKGFETKRAFIIDRIQKMYELTFSIAINNNIDFNKEFIFMINDATKFLNKYKKEKEDENENSVSDN